MLNTFMSKADYLAATGRKAPLINLEKSDQPEHLCIFFQSFPVRKENYGSYKSTIV